MSYGRWQVGRREALNVKQGHGAEDPVATCHRNVTKRSPILHVCLVDFSQKVGRSTIKADDCRGAPPRVMVDVRSTPAFAVVSSRFWVGCSVWSRTWYPSPLLATR